MQRKEAEKLLAALIFDDLDEASKTELLTYLQTDNELRERLADMRMAVKVASDTVQHGPDPVLGKRRLKRLARLARHQRSWPKFFTVPRLATAAAIFIIGIVGLAVLLPSLERASEKGIPLASTWARIEADYDERGERVWADSLHGYAVPTGPSSTGRRTAETPSIEGVYAFDPPADRSVAPGREQASGTIPTDGHLFAKAKKDIRGITNAQTPFVSGYVPIEASPQSEQTTEITSTRRQFAFHPATRGPGAVDRMTSMNDNALIQKQTLEDRMRRQIEAYRKKSKEGIDVPRKADMASIPYAGDITYPDRWQNIIASPYRKPEEPLGQDHYALEPPARGPEVVDSESGIKLPMTVINGQIQNDGRNFIVDDFGEFHGAETSFPQGYAYLPTKPDSIEKWASVSTWDHKPHSGIREVGGDSSDYVSIDSSGGGGGIMGRVPGGGMGGYGGGYAGGGYRGDGYGGMGGYGGGGYSGVGGSGRGMMVDYGVYGDGKGYSAWDWKGGNGRDAVNGSESGDRLFVKGGTYDGDKDFGSKETNLFDISSDDPAVVADGDSIAVGGRVTFQNGHAASIKNIELPMDNFTVFTDKVAGQKPVTVVAGQPVIFTKPDDPGIVSDGGGEAVGGGFFFQNG
ncbi:MAG: anti-sigma factor family protein, partial [Planctomycetota bacterium]